VPPTTPLGEALEQAADGLSMWCRDVAMLVKTDVDRMASGDYHLADLMTVGVRLLRVGLDNTIRMAGVASDNLALLTALPPETARRGAPHEKVEKVDVVVPVRAGDAGTIASSSLKGRATGQWVQKQRLTVTPSTYKAAGRRRNINVEVLVTLGGVPGDIYQGTLSVEAGGAVVDTVPFVITVDDIS
jgi:hypothetical protein